MKKWMAILVVFFSVVTVNAQYYDGPDRYFYEDEFDWRWDVRVRISDGHRSGYLTNREANRLYRRLEDIERKEWAFQSDGYYSVWEQDEIWRDVVDLHHAIGLELTDWDRRYYGYTGVVITRPLPWYFGTSYDFYRFDKRGYGSIHIGYTPRPYYPVKHVYYNNRKNYTTHWNNRPERIATPSRSSNARREVYTGRDMAPDRASTRPNGRMSEPSSRNDSRYSSSRVSSPDKSPSGTANRGSSSRVEKDNRSSSSRVGAERSSAPAKVEKNNSRVSTDKGRSSSPESSNARTSSSRNSSRSRD